MLKQMRSARCCAVLVLCLVLGGCATSAFDQARSHLHAGDPVAGVAVLDKAVQQDQIPQRDQLLLHLERGSMLYRAGDYQQSAQSFVKAATYLDQNGELSVSEQARSLLSNDWSKRYLGEYSERLWLHSYAMMSFLMANDPEGAAVEARRALKVIELYPEVLESDAFSKALIGLSFEMAGQHNDAYVAYRALNQNLPETKPMALSTYRSAKRIASSDGISTWRPKISDALWQAYANQGPEVVVLVSVGYGPVKTSGSLFYDGERLSFPSYLQSARTSGTLSVLDADNRHMAIEKVSTDTHAIAASALDKRGAKMLAKAALRGRLKHDLVKDLRDKDKVAAEVLNVVFFLLEEADTRGWSSLPERFSLVRVPVQMGQREIKVQMGSEQRVIAINLELGTRPQIFSLHF